MSVKFVCRKSPVRRDLNRVYAKNNFGQPERARIKIQIKLVSDTDGRCAGAVLLEALTKVMV